MTVLGVRPRKPLESSGGFIGVPLPTGVPGPVGPIGPSGIRGSRWTQGHGEPPPGTFDVYDLYLDVDTGDVWQWL